MGKGTGPAIPDIRAKSLSELYTDSVNSSIENLPKLYDAYSKYGPQYANTASQIFANQVPTIQNAYQQGNPLLKPTQDYARSYLDEAASGKLPDSILLPFQENLRSAQAARGVAESPISAVTEATQLGGVQEQFRQDAMNNATNLIAADPVSKALQAMTPVPLNASQLNLTPAPLSDLTQIGETADAKGVDTQFDLAAARQAQYNAALAKKQAMAKTIGAAGGAVIGAFAGNPMAGASIGSSVGSGVGTFF